MNTVTHRTVYTYSRDGLRCTVQHSITARHSEKASERHQEIVERTQPKRPGQWEMIESGGAGGGVDCRGLESTYYAKWQRVSA